MKTPVRGSHNDEAPPPWFDKWVKESFQPLLKSMQQSLSNLEMSDNPLSNNYIRSVPVIGADEHQATDRKSATYTLFDYPMIAPGYAIVGAAHRAMPLVTNEPQLVFIELPLSILKLDVARVFLADPYDPTFIHPLPVEKDLIVIQVNHQAPDMAQYRNNIPQYQHLSPEKKQTSGTSFVVGRGMDCPVKSRGGSVKIETGARSRGRLDFLLDVGEPGDSGTLLFVRRDDGTTFSPIAIFNGVEHSGNYHRRGRGAILPPLDTLTALDVVKDPAALLRLRNCGIGVACGNSPWCHCTVVTESTGAVQLQAPGGAIKYGVFVQAAQRIVYNGTMDINAKMRGQPEGNFPGHAIFER